MPPRIPLPLVPSPTAACSSPCAQAALRPITCSPSSTHRSFSQTCPYQLRRLPRWRRPKHDDPDFRDFLHWARTEGIKYKRPGLQPKYLENARNRRSGGRNNLDKDAAAREQQDEDDEAGAAASSAARGGGSSRGNFSTPFPLNPYFKSQPVLDEGSREAIYAAVVIERKSVREASTLFKVSMERVAAVVRMKQMERDWLEEGKKLVPYFSRQVLKMVPQTPYRANGKIEQHESINDLLVHSATANQVFWPASESRDFTRIDAGNAFAPGLLPADMRIPHPQLVDRQAAKLNLTRSMAMDRLREALERKLNKEEARRAERERLERDGARVVHGKRYDFRIKDIDIEVVGQDEKSRKGVGYRYGMPHNDRKRGLIKVPTSVP